MSVEKVYSMWYYNIRKEQLTKLAKKKKKYLKHIDMLLII